MQLTEVEVRAVINTLFGWLESRESGLILILTKAIHNLADANVPLLVQLVNERLKPPTPTA